MHVDESEDGRVVHIHVVYSDPGTELHVRADQLPRGPGNKPNNMVSGEHKPRQRLWIMGHKS